MGFPVGEKKPPAEGRRLVRILLLHLGAITSPAAGFGRKPKKAEQAMSNKHATNVARPPDEKRRVQIAGGYAVPPTVSRSMRKVG
jgi:hypothetical protein